MLSAVNVDCVVFRAVFDRWVKYAEVMYPRDAVSELCLGRRDTLSSTAGFALSAVTLSALGPALPLRCDTLSSTTGFALGVVIRGTMCYM